MAFYKDIDVGQQGSERIINGLLSLKALLKERKSKGPDDDVTPSGVPVKTLGKSVLLATWNIREFGRNQKRGARLSESLHYIAEIISAFDVVAVQEIDEDLTDFWVLMRRLGPDWGFLLTDITLGRQGNGERMGFIYDKRKIEFEGFASQVVLPPPKKNADAAEPPLLQLARTPMMVGFRCNWFRFSVCTVHIYYGTSKPADPRRVKEIGAVAKLLADRASSPHAWSPNLILLGDFNIFRPEDATAQAIIDAGFTIPEQLKHLEAGETGKHYDQMAFLSPRYDLQMKRDTRRARAGVVKFFDKVFRDEDEPAYAAHMGPEYAAHTGAPKRQTAYYRDWRSYQMSDHRLLWMELPADFSQAVLGKKKKEIAQNGKPSAPAKKKLRRRPTR